MNLDEFNIDVQALNHLPKETAFKYHILPVRVFEDSLVVAIDEAAYPNASQKLPQELHVRMRFVLSSHNEISRALRTHYPTSAA